MSGTPGWYPDPGGAPGRFRHWDGRAWSAETTHDPSQPPPPGTPGTGAGGPDEGGRRRRPGLVVGIVAGLLVLVLVLAAVFTIRALLDGGGPITGPPPPSPTASAWDETSRPDPTPSDPTPSDPTPSDPTPSPPPSPSGEPPPQQACPTGDPTMRDEHPSDGRVHGGGLSFPRVGGWVEDSASGLSWAYDVAGMSDQVEEGWFALVAVGALRMGDGFEEVQGSAAAITECLATSDYYAGFSGATELESGAVTVDGRPGWRIRTEVRVDVPTVEAEGDVLDVIVVDAGAGESLAMFVGAVPIDDPDRLRLLDETEAALTVD